MVVDDASDLNAYFVLGAPEARARIVANRRKQLRHDDDERRAVIFSIECDIILVLGCRSTKGQVKP